MSGSHSLTAFYTPIAPAFKEALRGTDYQLPEFEKAVGDEFTGIRVVIYTSHGPELPELHVPVTYLRERGADVVIATQDWIFDYQPSAPGHVALSEWLSVTVSVKADLRVSEALQEISKIDCLITIGGAWNPIVSRTDGNVLQLVREVSEKGGLLASICHGPQLLVSANFLPQGTRATGVADIRLDMKNAGFEVDETAQVIFDERSNLITSPDPNALKEFCLEIGRVLLKRKQESIMQTAEQTVSAQER